MADDNGEVKPKKLGTRAWRRLQWIKRYHRDEGFQGYWLKDEPRESLARLLEEVAQLLRQNLVTVSALFFYLNSDQPITPRIYEEYLRTPEWQDRRLEALDTAGHHCQVCNSEDGLEVHHRTYERIGDEEPGDLCVLCRECHGLFHRNRKLAR